MARHKYPVYMIQNMCIHRNISILFLCAMKCQLLLREHPHLFIWYTDLAAVSVYSALLAQRAIILIQRLNVLNHRLHYYH